MDVKNLIDDLRSRINPAYANQPGTESYERRLCAEALEALQARVDELEAENERLREDAERYLFLKPRLHSADFYYQDSEMTALIFEWPRTAAVSGNLDMMIDDARRGEKA